MFCKGDGCDDGTDCQRAFIADGTELRTPYGIAVNPENGDVYLTDAYQYTTNGDVYCFGSNGQKKFQFEAGINPNSIIFLQAN